jgi:hypothetical protein
MPSTEDARFGETADEKRRKREAISTQIAYDASQLLYRWGDPAKYDYK